VKALIFLLIACTAVTAQSKDDLKKKYGQPVAETYMIRPGINLTASYDSTGKITEVLIAPQLTSLIKSKGITLRRETIDAVIEELIPLSARGPARFGGFMNVGCMPQNDCYGSFMEYEKVSIYYNAANHGEVHYAVIQWK
jgi:hypothetical protein